MRNDHLTVQQAAEDARADGLWHPAPGPAVPLRTNCDEENSMRGTAWIDWTRTKLQPHEREDLLTALTSEQKEQLLERDYVWVKGIGVLWKPPDGALRRARFTHGTHFQTQRGRFALGPSPGLRIYPFGLGLVPNTRCLAEWLDGALAVLERRLQQGRLRQDRRVERQRGLLGCVAMKASAWRRRRRSPEPSGCGIICARSS